MRRGQRSVGQQGFTLLELIVVVVISAGLVAMLGLLFRQLIFTGEGLRSVDSDWGVQLFLRRQLLLRDERFAALQLFTGSPDELQFVSRYSARYASSGPPVVSRIQFDPNDGVLRYTETRMPPWWSDDLDAFSIRALLDSQDQGSLFQLDLMSRLQHFELGYFDREANSWVDRWSAETGFPLLIRLRLQRLGTTMEWLISTQSLRFPLVEEVKTEAE